MEGGSGEVRSGGTREGVGGREERDRREGGRGGWEGRERENELRNEMEWGGGGKSKGEKEGCMGMECTHLTGTITVCQ